MKKGNNGKEGKKEKTITNEEIVFCFRCNVYLKHDYVVRGVLKGLYHCKCHNIYDGYAQCQGWGTGCHP